MTGRYLLAAGSAVSVLALAAYLVAGRGTGTGAGQTRADLVAESYALVHHDHAYPRDGVWVSVSHWAKPGASDGAMICHVPFGPGSETAAEDCTRRVARTDD